ncbi:MAG: ComF family protein [Xanthomonadales bacterium]|nr:ComF family protein [Xanthomonadales bacterium]
MTSPDAHFDARTVRWTAKLVDALLPPHCILCGLASGHANLCAACRSELPRIHQACAQCALPLPGIGDRVCGACLVKPPPWNHAVAALEYAFPVSQLICRFKFNRNLPCGMVLAEELLRSLRNTSVRPQLIVPVPLHVTRQFKRVFNQAQVIARRIGGDLHIPVSSRHLRRIRRTPAQSGLDASARKRNLRGAFQVSPLQGIEHVALVDDVLTTGATLGEAAILLRRAGASEISVWVAARAPH